MATDTKIQDIAQAYIRKAVKGGCSTWPSTTIGELHSDLVNRLSLKKGELVLASGFFSPESWYAFTTRRIVSQFNGSRKELDPSHGIETVFGNAKGHGPRYEPGFVQREVAVVTAGKKELHFEYETWKASMIPIYAARYWDVKHPVIDKLMSDEEREAWRKKRAVESLPDAS